MKHLIVAGLLLLSFASQADETTVVVTTGELNVEKVSCTLFGRKIKLRVNGLTDELARLGKAGLKSDRQKGCAGLRDQIRERVASRNNRILADMKVTTRTWKRTEYDNGGYYPDYPNRYPRRPYPGYGYPYPGPNYRYGYGFAECVSLKRTTLDLTTQTVRRGDVPLMLTRSRTVETGRTLGVCRDRD